MSDTEKDYRSGVRKAKVAVWLASRASRDTGIFDRLCRRLLSRLTRKEPEPVEDQEDWTEAGLTFDPEELARYQRGESS